MIGQLLLNPGFGDNGVPSERSHLNIPDQTQAGFLMRPSLSPLRFLVLALLSAAVVLSCPALLLLWPVEAQDKAADRDAAAGAEVTQEQADFFRNSVLPLLEARCIECHGDEPEVEAELRLTSRKAMLTGGESGPVMVPGDPDQSLLIQAVRYEGFQMPPRSKMPDAEIEILARWIKDGAPWPADMESATVATEKTAFPLEERIAAHWAWKKIERPTVPTVKQADWAVSDSDRFLLAKMEAAGIAPAADADRRAILRRLYFDLAGMPPTLQQQDRFFNDPVSTAVALEKVVDELLASPQFGERWARHWLDLMRYAETLGHEFDYPLPYAWRYRDYVIRALNNDVPYNEFVREHLAGDLIENPRRHPELGFNESIIATGFWYLCEDKHAPVDVKGEEASRIDNQIDVFGKTFLGLTIACARCHDHKFDAITADDYYALSGFLQSSRRRVEWLDSHEETSKLIDRLAAAKLQTTESLNKGTAEFSSDRLVALLQRAMEPAAAGAAAAEQKPETQQVKILRGLLRDEKNKALSHPLSLLAALAQAPPDSSDADQIALWLKQRHDAALPKISPDAITSGWAETTVGTPAGGTPTAVAADLRQGLPANWRAFGAALGSGRSGEIPRQAITVSLTPAAFVADSPMSVSSASLSPKLRGELHSPEFVLTHPEIQILAAGKGTRVRLSIDGYVMNEFSELLFGGCRQPIETEGEFRWIRVAGDVQRYIGHRCHLEFLDEGDGWFAVREIRMMGQSNESPVARQEICKTNASLTVSPQTTREQLIKDAATRMASDPAWAAVVFKSGLSSSEQRTAYETSLEAFRKEAEQPQSGDPVLVMCEGPGEDEYVFIRGNHNNRGPTAGRHMLTALDQGAPLQNPHGSGRMELADRVLAEDNPFPARVIVNRVWQHLFGRGIVSTSDNFGVLGEQPTHPELLDFLAGEFRHDGWSIKRLVKRLVMSRAYRLSSQRTELAEQTDPSNKLLQRFSVRRVEGEVLRDAMLCVSGRLDSAMFGPPVPVYLSNFMQGRGRPGQSGPLDGAGRRSIYQAVNRNFLNPFMLAFDTPQPATAVGRRSISNVPAQALMLMNNEFVHEQANVWSARLLNEVSGGGDELLAHAFRQAFARTPSDTEAAAFHEFAQAVAMERNLPADLALRDPGVVSEICHVLMNQKEFVFLD